MTHMLRLIALASLALAFLSFNYISNTEPTKSVNDRSLTATNFEDSTRRLYDQLGLEKSKLDFSVFRLGMIGYQSLKTSGALKNSGLISIIDFTKPSTEKRFYTIDLAKRKLLFHTYVAHGKNTGENRAVSFSNLENSNQSSLGFYVTGETYVGSKGFSLRLDGQDSDYNGKIRIRGVVMHSADYVSESWIKKYGRLGRSQGCPALPKEVYKKVIETIKDGSMIFAYYNDPKFLSTSRHLDYKKVMDSLNAISSVAP